MPVSARSNGGPAAISSAARGPLPSLSRATIATRSILCSSPRWPRVLAFGASLTSVAVSSRVRVHVLEGVARLGVGAGERELERRVDNALRLAVESGPLLRADGELGAQVLDRVTRLLQFPQLVLVAINLRVSDVVAAQALGLADEENGAATGASVLERV